MHRYVVNTVVVRQHIRKGPMLCSVDLLFCFCQIVFLKLFRRTRAACDPRATCWFILDVTRGAEKKNER